MPEPSQEPAPRRYDFGEMGWTFLNRIPIPLEYPRKVAFLVQINGRNLAAYCQDFHDSPLWPPGDALWKFRGQAIVGIEKVLRKLAPLNEEASVTLRVIDLNGKKPEYNIYSQKFSAKYGPYELTVKGHSGSALDLFFQHLFPTCPSNEIEFQFQVNTFFVYLGKPRMGWIYTTA